MNDPLPIPAPIQSPETEAFLAAAAEGRLLIGRCRTCGKAHYFPRHHCPACFSDAVDFEAASGDGTIYSLSVARRGPPHVIAYVELAEGPRMLTNIVDADPDALAIGDRVRLVFRAAEDGQAVPMFAPAPGSGR